VSFEHLYHRHASLIDRVIAFVCRRHRVAAADADDFAGVVRLKLVQDDYLILRKFEERSSLQTYLTSVIIRLYQDYRVAQWGKWRPSAEARRTGPIAIRLETLMQRDGLSFDEAYETLRTNYAVDVPREELFAMSLRSPRRTTRRTFQDDGLESVPAEGGDGDEALRYDASQMQAARAAQALHCAIDRLPPEDRLIVRMRFADAFSVADIARTLGVDQKPLYRRLDRLMSDLRGSLEAAGIRASDASGWVAGGFHFPIFEAREMATPRPSIAQDRSTGAERPGPRD
jgi:RNA polymerase sigma factor for flagellar operon FliA